jgi:hypothetical protein
MAKKNVPQLDEGFEEVPLDEGFEDVPLTEPKLIKPEKSTLESVGETAYDTARAAGTGLLAGGLEEFLAAGEATFSPEEDEWSKKYRKFLEIQEQKSKESQERSPTASFIGEVGGSLLPAFATGGASLAASGGAAAARLGGKELLKAAGKGALAAGGFGAATGALQGALTSEEGRLIGATEEEREKLFEDAKSGAIAAGGLSALLGAGAPIAAKGVQKFKGAVSGLADKDILGKQIKEAFQSGQAKTDYGSISGARLKTTEVSQGVEDITNVLTSLRNKAYEQIEKPLEYATQIGKRVSLEIPDTLVTSLKQAGASDELISVVDKLKQKVRDPLTLVESSSLTPNDAYILRKQLKDSVGDDNKLRSAIKPILNEIDDKIENVFTSDPNLKQDLERVGIAPSFKEGLETYKEVVGNLLESITQKGLPAEARDKFLSDTKSQAQVNKLYKGVEDLVEDLMQPGEINKVAVRTLENPSGGLKVGFQRLKENPKITKQLDAMTKELGFENIDDLQNRLVGDIENVSLKSSTKRAITGEKAYAEGVPTKKDIFSLGRQALGKTAYLGGRAQRAAGETVEAISKIKPIDISRKIYNLPEEKLKSFAIDLSKYPKYENYAKNLQTALDSGNTVKKQAILFALLQNPDFRNNVADFFTPGEENE